MERVDRLVQASKPLTGWGSPHLSTTPNSLAIQGLAAQIRALESAVLEIALEVQRLSADAPAAFPGRPSR
jgi:hypothetical protein